jgi:FAD/FMN-containing dehydrogenase
MSAVILRKLDASNLSIERAAILQELGSNAIFPDSPNYDEARGIWNAMIDRKPAVIVEARSEQDVINAVQFAARRGLLVAVRSGGHNIAGKAVCDDGLVIDLRAMNRVAVDADARRARVGPGATLGDVDAATQAHALVVPTGINSTTGIAGLTLGGGFGWTTRKYGLTIDNLLSARVVTADGQLKVASATDNPDLFWAIRGGGGNFGVVTEFEFALHPLGPTVFAGMVVHALADVPSVIPAYQQAVAAAPADLTCWAVLRKAPPLPFIPPEWHGREIIALPMCFIGDPKDGPAVTEPLSSIGKPIAAAVGPQPFVDWQKAFDPLLTPGARNYWKTHDMQEFSGDAIQIIQAAIENLPGDECEVFFGHVGGKMTQFDVGATAWPNRRAHYAVNVHTRWRDSVDDARCVAWARQLHADLAPHAMGTYYVNFIPEGDEGMVEQAYGPNFERLRAIKAKLDPQNLFRANINVS